MSCINSVTKSALRLLQDQDVNCACACRKYLKQKPPSGLSWHGSIKLDDELSAGVPT